MSGTQRVLRKWELLLLTEWWVLYIFPQVLLGNQIGSFTDGMVMMPGISPLHSLYHLVHLCLFPLTPFSPLLHPCFCPLRHSKLVAYESTHSSKLPVHEDKKKCLCSFCTTTPAECFTSSKNNYLMVVNNYLINTIEKL